MRSQLQTGCLSDCSTGDPGNGDLRYFGAACNADEDNLLPFLQKRHPGGFGSVRLNDAMSFGRFPNFGTPNQKKLSLRFICESRMSTR